MAAFDLTAFNHCEALVSLHPIGDNGLQSIRLDRCSADMITAVGASPLIRHPLWVAQDHYWKIAFKWNVPSVVIIPIVIEH